MARARAWIIAGKLCARDALGARDGGASRLARRAETRWLAASASVTTGARTADGRDVERAIRRVNRRIGSAVGAFASGAVAGAGAVTQVGRTRTRDAATAAEKLFVWLHGYADADGESWREFCDVIVREGGRTCAVVCPDAPEVTAEGTGVRARAWFKPRLHVRRDGRSWTCDGIEESVESVVRLVDAERERLAISRRDVVLGGFSQGACLALACAKSELSDVGGILAVRGYLPNRSREFADLKPSTLILAGGNDPLVPLEWSLEAGRLTGGDVVIRKDMGHELCVEDVYQARLWMRRRFT